MKPQNQMQKQNQKQNQLQNRHVKKKKTNKEFALITYFFLVLFCGMLTYFVYFQIIGKEEYISSTYNGLQDLYAAHVVRGDIISADGEILATTDVAENGD